MTTDSVSQTSDAATARRLISNVVCRSLKSALATQCRRRHDTDVTVERLDRSSSDQPLQIRLECADDTSMTVTIRVSHVGGNVYDVHCGVEEGPSRTFTYSLPGLAGVALSRAPCLGRKLGTFLLEKLEQQIGRRHLRGG